MKVRTLLALCGLLLTAIIMIGIFAPQHEQMKNPEPGRNTFPQVLERMYCRAIGGCYSYEGHGLPPYLAQNRIETFIPSNPGFITPPWAEPEPTEERQARLQNLLLCTNEAFSDVSEYDWPTERSLYWNEGEAAPIALVERADNGDADSMFDLAYGYLSGHSDLTAEASDQTGFEWLLAAAENGHMVANSEVGAAYAFGYFGQNIDYPAARRFLNLAVEAEDPVAMLTLALLPPAPGEDLSDYADNRLELELRSAELCYIEGLAHISRRLQSPTRGLETDVLLANRIARRATGIDVVGEPNVSYEKQPNAEAD
ncbi:MAG: sel1 repeat family protein [Oceanicaulis sp.]|jgi:TPR repeat protein|nr:sel1 repeat family protein [Oceanicaulis sp.]